MKTLLCAALATMSLAVPGRHWDRPTSVTLCPPPPGEGWEWQGTWRHDAPEPEYVWRRLRPSPTNPMLLVPGWEEIPCPKPTPLSGSLDLPPGTRLPSFDQVPTPRPSECVEYYVDPYTGAVILLQRIPGNNGCL